MNAEKHKALIEALAEIEHQQWMHWSQAVVAEVPEATQTKWRCSWLPYRELPDERKESDRIWARKVVELLHEHKLIAQP